MIVLYFFDDTVRHVLCHALCTKNAPNATVATPATSRKPPLDELWADCGFSSAIRSGAVLRTLALICQQQNKWVKNYMYYITVVQNCPTMKSLLSTVEPSVSGHPWGLKKCPLKRGVHLCGVTNVVFVYCWVHD